MPTKPKNHKPLSPKTQAAVDELATKLADVLLEEGVELDELARMDERVLPLVRRIGNKALEEIAKIKVDSTVRQNEDLGRKVHRSKTIVFEYIFGAVAIESPYLWRNGCGGLRPTRELLRLPARGRSELVIRALTDFGAEECQTSFTSWTNHTSLPTSTKPPMRPESPRWNATTASAPN